MIAEHDLSRIDAYADGALDAVGAADVERHLEACAACAARLQAVRDVSTALRSAPYFRAPDRLRQRLAPTAPAAPRRTWVPWAIAMAASLVAAVAIVRPLVPRSAGDLTEAVVANHVRSLMAAHLVDVESTDRHTVKPWFAGRIDFSPTVVDLADAGFPLVGGRLDYIENHPAAALVYRRREHMINVLTWSGGPDAALTHERDDPRGYHILHWAGRGSTWWVVSDLALAELDDFATRLQASVTSGS